MTSSVVNNVKRSQFEIHMDGEIAEMVYRVSNGTIYYMHTWVPESLRGRGLAPKLAEAALRYGAENNWIVKLYCPFTAQYVERHPEWKDKLNIE